MPRRISISFHPDKTMQNQCALSVIVTIILNCIVSLDSSIPWGDRQLFPPSQIPDNAMSPRRSAVRRKIVVYHNFFRSKVEPPASNMLMMTWHPGAARQAQQFAEKCEYLVHNSIMDRTVPSFGGCGQNLFTSSQKATWFFAIKTWYLEYKNFTYGSPYFNFERIGHYTQMVWATTQKLGCGVAHCPGGPWGSFYNYVCHYCPTGNHEGATQYPYKAGVPCGDCPENCIGNKLCTNYCSYVDEYGNCEQLEKFPDTCGSGRCNATCYCKGKIHKNYPWL